jgi:hypothetical protein
MSAKIALLEMDVEIRRCGILAIQISPVGFTASAKRCDGRASL